MKHIVPLILGVSALLAFVLCLMIGPGNKLVIKVDIVPETTVIWADTMEEK